MSEMEQVEAVKAGAQSCPKCGLEAKMLLHRFCTHKFCPVREALRPTSAQPNEGGEG